MAAAITGIPVYFYWNASDCLSLRQCQYDADRVSGSVDIWIIVSSVFDVYNVAIGGMANEGDLSGYIYRG